MSEIMLQTLFVSVSTLRITAVTNFEKAKMCKTNSNFEKSKNNLNIMYTVCARGK